MSEDALIRLENLRRLNQSAKELEATVGVLLVFAGYALYANQSAVILDILKVLVGFAVGMGFQAYRTYSKQEDSD